MTIDDNVDFLNEVKKFFQCIAHCPSLNKTIKTYYTIESLKSAIKIMRKYQKIQEILKDTPYGGDCDDAVRRIQEVIEDDNSTVDNSSM